MSDGLKSARETLHSRKPKPAKQKAPDSLKHQLRNFAPWINRFGCSLFRRLRSSVGKDADVAVVPSALFVFVGAMSRVSEDEDTEETCDGLFGRTPDNMDKLAKEMAKLAGDHGAFKWSQMAAAFVPADRKLDRDFVEKTEDQYSVKVVRMPSKEDGQRNAEVVNRLIKEGSEEHLAEMVDADQADGRKYPNSMLVVGAYVHPWWQRRFDRTATKEEDFYENEKTSYRTPMMNGTWERAYVRADLSAGVVVDVLGVPCRGNGATVYLITPVKRFGLDRVSSRLTGDRVSNLISYCRPRMVRLTLPKLHTTVHCELRKQLAAMGVDAWLNDHQPALDGVTKRGGAVAVGPIHHQLVIKMNEDGDEPGQETKQKDSSPHVKFRCDQPFIIVFHHALSNAIWMMAEIKRPNTKGPRPPEPASRP